MRSVRINAFYIFIVLIFAFPIPAISQTLSGRVIWTTSHCIEISSKTVRYTSIIGHEKTLDISLPAEILWVSSRRDGVYTLVDSSSFINPNIESANMNNGMIVLRRLAGSSIWESFAELPKLPGGPVRAALPTSDGRLFLVPNGAFLSTPDASEWAPFLLVGKDKEGRWNQFETINLEWGPPFKKQIGIDGRSSWTLSARQYLFLASAAVETPELSDRIFELEDGWVFLNRHHGMIWVFDNKGKIQRRITIHTALTEADLSRPLSEFPMAILACTTLPGNRMIIASRGPSAFFFSRKLWPVSEPGTPPQDLLWKETQAATDYPEITWAEVDLDSGNVKSIPSPPGLPTKYVFRPEDPNWHFHIPIALDGYVGNKPSLEEKVAKPRR